MLISNKNILFSFLLILSAFFFSFSYNFETYSLIEATIQSGLINYPDEFNLHQVINMNSWSLPIQIISILVKKNISILIISRIILFVSTLVFLISIYLIVRSLSGSSLMAFLIAFLVILLKKNFGGLDYPTVMFSEHTNGLVSQAFTSLVLALFISSNFRLGFFLSAILISVHVTIGIWINSVIFFILILKFKKYKNIILNQKIYLYFILGLIITLISLFYFFSQKLPLNLSYDHEAYKTYMSVWESHRTGYGLYSKLINYSYIFKTLFLVSLAFIFLRLKLNKVNSDFGIIFLLVSCIFSLFLYISYKYFYLFFPDFITRLMPTRFLLLHSVIGWPIIFSIFYVLIKFIFERFNFNLSYVYNFFILILIINLLQHNSNFIDRYKELKANLFISTKYDSNEKFWMKLKTINLDGFFLTNSDPRTCLKTIVLARKPLFSCMAAIDFIPYIPSSAGLVKKIVEEVFDIPFDNPKIKNMGGIHDIDLKLSFENKTHDDWVNLKNKFNIVGLIIPKGWEVNLEVSFSNNFYNFYIIQ